MDKIVLVLLNLFALLRAIFISMNLLEENIRKIAEGSAEENGFFVVDLIIRGSITSRVIEVFIDGEKDVSAEDCAEVSRKILSIFEERELINSSYRLDVSSPGVDRPLKFLKQYPKHLNRRFEVIYSEGEEKKTLRAKLAGVDGENLIFSPGRNEEIIINFNNIINAKVTVSFS